MPFLSTFYQSMFVTFDGPAMYVAIQSVLSVPFAKHDGLRGYSCDCMSCSVPICDGSALPHTMLV